MPDLAAMSPVAAIAARPLPPTSAPPVTGVAAAGAAGGSRAGPGGEGGTGPGGEGTQLADRLVRQREFGPETIPGPAPAFEASLLELERDLKAVLARLEALRSMRAEEEAAPAEAEAEAVDSLNDEPEAAEPAMATEKPEAPSEET